MTKTPAHEITLFAFDHTGQIHDIVETSRKHAKGFVSRWRRNAADVQSVIATAPGVPFTHSKQPPRLLHSATPKWLFVELACNAFERRAAARGFVRPNSQDAAHIALIDLFDSRWAKAATADYCTYHPTQPRS